MSSTIGETCLRRCGKRSKSFVFSLARQLTPWNSLERRSRERSMKTAAGMALPDFHMSKRRRSHSGRQHFRALPSDEHRVRDVVIAAARTHESGQHMEAHACLDGEIRIATKPSDRIATRP